jgi:hypothetical protein
LQGVDLFHVLGVFWIDQKANCHRTVAGTYLLTGDSVAATAVVDPMDVLILIDHLLDMKRLLTLGSVTVTCPASTSNTPKE